MKNAEAAISSWRGKSKTFKDWGGGRGRGVKNFRTRAVRDLGGLILLGEGQYPITCHGFFK